MARKTARSADEVSGTFTVNGTATSFKYVYSFWNPNFFDKTKPNLFLLFSDAPIPPK